MRPRLYSALFFLIFTSLSGAASAQHEHQHQRHDDTATPTAAPVFIASSAKQFGALMDDAMAVMDDGMRRAAMDGGAEHDFNSMMIPHHQGAIDMAKAVLLNTHDPEILNLALGIIAEQQNEIKLMQAWLARHTASIAPTSPVPLAK